MVGVLVVWKMYEVEVFFAYVEARRVADECGEVIVVCRCVEEVVCDCV